MVTGRLIQGHVLKCKTWPWQLRELAAAGCAGRSRHGGTRLRAEGMLLRFFNSWRGCVFGSDGLRQERGATITKCIQHNFNPARYAQLVEDAEQVILHCVFGQMQASRNLTIRQAFGDAMYNFLLAA